MLTQGCLFLFFVDFQGNEILGLEDLTAVEAFDVVDAVATGNHLGSVVIADDRHNTALQMKIILAVLAVLSSPPKGNDG
jgi:hypothetical protein